MRSWTAGQGLVRRMQDDEGVSLVEVLVAITLLVTVFMAMVSVATTGLFSLRSTADRTTAVDLSTQAVEAARHLPWEQLGLDDVVHNQLPDPQCGTLVDIDAAGSVSEPVICLNSAGVAGQLPYWGQDGPYTLQTYVTSILGYTNARRITAITTWQDRGQQREVRTSTVVAAVERG